MFITHVLTLLGPNYLVVYLYIEAHKPIFINVYNQCFNPLRAKCSFICLFIEALEHIFINVYSQCFNPLRANFFICLFVY